MARTKTRTDTLDQKAWDTITVTRDRFGNITERRTTFDDGRIVTKSYDRDGAVTGGQLELFDRDGTKDWDSITKKFDVNGALISEIERRTVYDSGRVATQSFDADGNLINQVNELDTGIVREVAFDANERVTQSVSSDPNDLLDWHTITRVFDETGQQIGESIQYDSNDILTATRLRFSPSAIPRTARSKLSVIRSSTPRMRGSWAAIPLPIQPATGWAGRRQKPYP
ncbi:MAG: hypothetical protein OIF47_11030 [Marinibacterium sp.]|nr:hypothetical protein [Marinibacterium sp.]